MGYIIAVNAGSSSTKYSIFQDGLEVEQVNFEVRKKVLPQKYLKDTTINAFVFRVVHGGEKFTKPLLVDQKVLKELKKISYLAPLHNPVQISLMKKYLKSYPHIPCVAVFDTAFHTSIPEVNTTIAIPKKLRDSGVRKYGFHGISIASSLHTLKKLNKTIPQKIIVCHLGSGCSITAVKNGKSFDTSMGYTPLDGMLMMTRAGSIDPGIVLKMRNTKHVLNFESGMLALCGTSDMREVIKKNKAGDTSAQLAFQMFIQSAVKHIGSYAFEMGGCNCIIFTGAIGEGSSYVREQICKRLEFFGIDIDAKINEQEKDDFCFSTKKSKVEIWKIKARENQEMVREAKSLLLPGSSSQR